MVFVFPPEGVGLDGEGGGHESQKVGELSMLEGACMTRIAERQHMANTEADRHRSAACAGGHAKDKG